MARPRHLAGGPGGALAGNGSLLGAHRREDLRKITGATLRDVLQTGRPAGSSAEYHSRLPQRAWSPPPLAIPAALINVKLGYEADLPRS